MNGEILETVCKFRVIAAVACRDEKPADALTVRHGPETDEYNRDFIERDEKRLADLGRKTVEMYVIAHIIADLEVCSRSSCSARPVSSSCLCPLWLVQVWRCVKQPA